jgi:hypothetical protein
MCLKAQFPWRYAQSEYVLINVAALCSALIVALTKYKLKPSPVNTCLQRVDSVPCRWPLLPYANTVAALNKWCT